MTENKFKDIRMEAFQNKDTNVIFTRAGLGLYEKAKSGIENLFVENSQKLKEKKNSIESNIETTMKKEVSKDD